MPTLYIIGNGFDLFNGFKTRYADFHNFVTQNFPDLENKIENYFLFETDDKYLWKNFENDLTTFQYENLLDDLNNIDVQSESFKPSEVFGLEDEINEEVENLIADIKNAFREWIEELELPAKKTGLAKIKEDANFINFNYTDTLEAVYSVPSSKILYIHNKANDYTSELIFGHGVLQEKDPAKEELDEFGESNRTLFTDSENAARYPFYALIKNTASILDSNSTYFDNIKSFNEIIVLGHSLGEVDWPYFKKVQQLLPDTNWKISYYSQEEKLNLKSTAIEMLGINDDKIQMIRIDEL